MKTKKSLVVHAAAVVAAMGAVAVLNAQNSSDGRPVQREMSPGVAAPRDAHAGAGIHAGDPGAAAREETPKPPTVERLEPETDGGRARQVSDLVGTRVNGPDNEKVGEVGDFLVDSRSSRAEFAVIASGGVLGVGETLRLVPVESLQMETAGGVFALNLARDKWEGAPVFEKEQLATLGAERVRQLQRHYGVRDHAQPGGQRDAAGAGEPGRKADADRRLLSTSDVIGRDIRNGSQTVGTVDDVMLHVKSRVAVALVDANDEFAGTDQNFIVPLSKLERVDDGLLRTTLSARELAAVRPADVASWGESLAEDATAIYLWPASRAARTASTTDTTRAAPLAAIREAIRRETNRSDIRIVPMDDKVVLSGVVRSKDEKKRIGEQAENAAGSWDVDNQIRVAEQGDPDE